MRVEPYGFEDFTPASISFLGQSTPFPLTTRRYYTCVDVMPRQIWRKTIILNHGLCCS